jgi:2-haloacid dehalogenase
MNVSDTHGSAGARSAVPTVAFDVIGTLFTLDRPRSELAALGAPEFAVNLWLAQTLRDSYAWSLAGRYRPLKEFLEAALPRTLLQLGIRADESQRGTVLGSLGELDPASGAQEAVEGLSEAGWRLVTLTNGSEEFTRGLLDSAGFGRRFVATLSCDAIEKTKPHPDVYDMAKREAAGEVWLVAGHAWDVAGANAAGLRTAWISTTEKEFLSVYPQPDIVADDLAEAAERMIAPSGEDGPTPSRA